MFSNNVISENDVSNRINRKATNPFILFSRSRPVGNIL